MEDRYYTMRDLAKLLDVHEKTVYNWKKAGMPCIQRGRTVRINGSEAIEWLKNQKRA